MHHCFDGIGCFCTCKFFLGGLFPFQDRDCKGIFTEISVDVEICKVSACASSAVSCIVWPSCQRNSEVLRKGRVVFSQRMTEPPLVIQHRQVTVGVDDMREVFAEQRLRGRTNAQPFGQGILSADRNPCAFGRKALDMVLFLLQQASGISIGIYTFS